ncbi:MAG: LysR family transcriptional regulator [Lachnospiraceae bacterium]
MNVKGCEYIVAIDEQGNISRAAKVLGISQPSLSAYLKQVEWQLGVSLFTYCRRKMMPTKAGEAYLRYCHEIIDIKNQTYHLISAKYNAELNSFSIGLTPHRSSTIFAQLYPELIKKYPKVSLHIKEGYTGELYEMLEKGELDFIICSFDQQDEERYQIIPDTREALLVCLPSFNPIAKAVSHTEGILPTIDASSLQNLPLVMWSHGTVAHRVAKRYLSQNMETEPTVIFESNNARIIDQMLSSGVGAGFLPASYCQPSSQREYFQIEPPLGIGNGVIAKQNKVFSEEERYFIYKLITRELNDRFYTREDTNARREIIEEFEQSNEKKQEHR